MHCAGHVIGGMGPELFADEVASIRDYFLLIITAQLKNTLVSSGLRESAAVSKKR